MMKKLKKNDIEFHSFHWDNFNSDVLKSHKKVMEYLGINVIYTMENIPHGEWLDKVMKNATKKVIAI